jgi:hypothetical protein
MPIPQVVRIDPRDLDKNKAIGVVFLLMLEVYLNLLMLLKIKLNLI